MSIAGSAPSARRLPRIRLGRIILPLAIVAVVAGVAYWFLNGGDDGRANAAAGVLVQKVSRGVFEHNVVEPGELESSNNVEVRCEVEARNSTGTVILEIVPNGAEVQPGDFLIRFDSSALEQERNQQQIAVNDAKALVIQAQTAFDTAVIAKQEYVEGTFKQEEQLMLGELFVAEENLRRAEEYARYSERLAAKGYVTSDQVEADRFAVEKGRNDVDAVHTRLKVLREYTKKKMIITLDAAIETARGTLESDQYTLKLAEEKLAHIDRQIANCVVKAPAAGKVVYANETNRRGGSEIIIEEGAIMRERQTVLRLPDLTQMQVAAKINETRISYVHKGMKANVKVDAFPGMTLSGRVVRVDEYPVPPSWMSQSVKQYATYIALDDPPEGIRPGLTVQVEINVDHIPDALKAPVQAVVERNGEYYCVVRKGQRLEPKWIDIGPTNDQEVLIRAGIEAGDDVVIDPEPLLAEVDLPRAPPGYWDENPRYQSIARRGKSGPPTGIAGAEKGPGEQRPGEQRPGEQTPFDRTGSDRQQAEGTGSPSSPPSAEGSDKSKPEVVGVSS